MTKLVPSVLFASLLMVGAAAAQTSPPASEPDQQNQPSASNDMTENAPVKENSFRQNLEKAGFKDVDFVNAAYVVQADTQSGETVVMSINPARLPASAEQSSNSTSGSGSSTASEPNQQPTQAVGRKQLRQALEKSGFKNVKVLSAAYVVRATTPDGKRVAMTVSPAE